MARFTVVISDDMEEALDLMSKKQQISKKEVVRKALKLLLYLQTENALTGSEKKLSITEGGTDKVLKDIVLP
jgi:metal-responsive CopG/Arc/MetJ family transcriptional regulator